MLHRQSSLVQLDQCPTLDLNHLALGPTLVADSDLFHIRSHQGQGGQSGRSDGKTLAGGSRGVAQAVQGIGPFADNRIQARHLGVASRVVGNRAVGVRRQSQPQGAQHADSSQADSVKTHGKLVGVPKGPLGAESKRQQDRRSNHHDRNPDAVQSLRHTRNDQRRRTTLGLLGDCLSRSVLVAGRVLGPPADQPAGQQANRDRNKQADVVRQQDHHQHERGSRHGHAAVVDALAQCLQQVLLTRVLVCLHQVHTPDRQADPRRSQHQWQHQGPELEVDPEPFASAGKRCNTQGGTRQDRPAVRLVQVRTHASHVAHIVAHVVGNRRRVPRIILGDPRLDLAHQVGTHVGRLGENAAADSSKQRLGTRSHAETKHRHRDLGQRHLESDQVLQVPQSTKPQANVQ